MRIFALIFFTLTLPITVFVATVLYGGFSTTILKTELARSNIYSKTLDVLAQPPGKDTTSQDQQQNQLIAAITVFITPTDLQQKTEQAIDDSAAWITDETTTPPVLSFKEIKNQIESQSPGLLTNIEDFSQSLQKQTTEQSLVKQKKTEKNLLTEFIKNDFSFPLQQNLQGVKDTYDNLKIIFPALVAFLIVYLALLLLVNHNWKFRFRWIGITLLLSGFLGYLIAVCCNFVTQMLIGAFLKDSDPLFQTIGPLIKNLLSPFTSLYLHYQTLVTFISLIIGGVALGLSFILKGKPTSANAQPKKVKLKIKKKK